MPPSSVDGGSITGARRSSRRRHRFFQRPAAGCDGGHGGADAILVRGRRQHHQGATVSATLLMPSYGSRGGADAVLVSGRRQHHRGATVQRWPRRRWHHPCQVTASASMGRDGCRLHSGPVHAVAAQQLVSRLGGGRGGANAVLVSGWRQHQRGAMIVAVAPPFFSASFGRARRGPRRS